MTDIELRNENGKIVGYDADGNKVSVDFEEVGIESLSSDTNTASYVVTKVGSTFYAVGQRASLSDESDSDAAVVLQHAIDNCPVNGSVFVREGVYDLATSGPLTMDHPEECTIIGEARALPAGIHLHDKPTNGVIFDVSDAAKSAIEINKGGTTPDDKISPTIENILFTGSGESNGVAAIKADVTDVLRVEDCSFRKFEWGLDDTATGTATELYNNLFVDVGNGAKLSDKAVFARGNRFFEDVPGHGLRLDICKDSEIMMNWFDNGFTTAGAHGIHDDASQESYYAWNYFSQAEAGIHLDGAKRPIVGPNTYDAAFSDGLTDGIFITANSEDVSIKPGMFIGAFGNAEVNDQGSTRPRWRDVLGGGPLGGINLKDNDGQRTGDLGVHDGTGVLPQGLKCRWDGASWKLLEPASFSYTGDGTESFLIESEFQFEVVIIEEAGGTVVDAYAGGLSNGALSGSTFTGDVTIRTNGGFRVDDGGSDADPNTDGETYEVYVA